MESPFDKKTGSEILKSPLIIGLIICISLPIGFFIAKGGIMNAALLIALPLLYGFLYWLFKKPSNGLYVFIALSFTAIGLTRYVKGIPFGLSIDGILVITFLALFFKNFFTKLDWKPIQNSLFYISLIWFIYNVLELVNPEARSAAAWFYAMRGVALYFVLAVLITLMLLRDVKHLNKFLYIWGAFSILVSIKGAMQLIAGVDPWEQAWLNAGAAETHILFGKLRVFSFLSDAGTFGAQQGHAAVIGIIVGLNSKTKKDKIFFLTMGLLGLYGLAISGTRGAIAVPVGGGMIYFIMKKNVKILILGAILGISVFVFFKYTTIGNGNYQINRMRSAFDPNDPSLQVRLENQRKLKVYMKSRPFGGGIGSSGNWGLRFSPGTFLAETPTDSWYVKIWVEEGIIGLLFHIFYLLFILGYGCYIIWTKVTDPEIAAKLTALAGGILGIMLASYGNAVFGQLPTGPLIYVSMAMLYMGELYNKQTIERKLEVKNENIEIES